jgi:probable addiction module antidote protein
MRTKNNITKNYDDWLLETLKDHNEAAEYLQGAMIEYQEDDNVEALLLAIRNVAIAQGGISTLAEKSNLSRESLYRTLSSHGNPRLSTLNTVLHALGFGLAIKTV